MSRWRGVSSRSGWGECAKLAKYLRNRAPGLALAQKSVLRRLEALAERWSVQAVSLGCICWYLVRELHKRPAHARRRALSRHLLGAYGALQDRLGAASASLSALADAELTPGRYRALTSLACLTPGTPCLGPSLLVCVKMNHRILIGALSCFP